jgi:hypothetical protein
MEHLAQGEDIHMRPSSARLLALSEDRNIRVEVLDQGMTNYQPIEDMSKMISLLHYSELTRTIEDDMWIIGSREGNMYRLLEQKEEVLIHDEVNPNELWHRRYTHINYQSLPFLKRMVEGIPELKSTHEGICKGCALGKNIKKPFPGSNNRSKEILDLIHSDVCGLMPVRSLGGSLYYVIFINDHSRKTWLYLLKTKDKVFSEFQEFKTEIENLTNKRSRH